MEEMKEKQETEEKKVIRMDEHKKQKKGGHISVKKIAAAIGGCAVFVVIVIALACPIKTIRLDGMDYYSQPEVMQAVKKNGYNGNSVVYWLKSKIAQPKLLPFIESFTVEIEKPDTIRIHVNERKRAGCLAFNGKYVYFDKNGYALESSKMKYKDVPLVTGLNYKTLVMQEKIPVKKKEIFSYILELTMAIDKYNLPIDQIYMKQDGNALLLSKDLTVDLYNRKNIDIKIPELAGILKKLKGKSGTIDMKYFEEYQKITIFRPKKS
jgi:cell division protein FtsQ